MSILDHLRRAVEQRPDHPYLVHEGQRVSFGEFDQRTNRLANALLAAGIERGDRVTLALGSSIEYAVASIGVLKAGAVTHPINAQLGGSQLAYILGHAEPSMVIADRASADAFRALCSDGASPRLASLDRVDATFDLAAASAASPATSPPVEIKPGDPLSLMYTSGTTGNPKGVLGRHSGEERPDPFVGPLGIGPDDVLLAVTPLFHGNAWGAAMTALRSHISFAFPRSFHGSLFWPLAHETGATVLFTLGTILAMLLTREPCEEERTSQLRAILGLGSAPIRDQVIERFGVTEVLDCFGSTDAGVVTVTPPGEAPRAGSAGKPIAGVEVQIHDDAGQALGPGEVGEIVVSAPPPRSEYFRDPEATRAAYRGDWFLTGDLGFLDEDGWLHFVDRKKDFIRRGGENVSSVWVEKTLREHPAVVEAAVVGVPHPVLGQEIVAFVVAGSEVSSEELRSFARERLAPFEVPAAFELRDALPKTPTQRVEKYRLREELGGLGDRLLG
jgi:acyl-CoA synthetase (AMP-forming)/AMP-acid ligase II